MARPLDEVDGVLRRLLRILAAVVAGGAGLGIALGAVVARSALRPVRRFTERTEALTDDPDPSHRLDVQGRDELARLAGSFNTTLDSLERSIEQQRSLVADASHELRTPLASVRTNVQVLARADDMPADERTALLRETEEQLAELSALVADVVDLARGGERDEPREDVRLDELVRGVVERMPGDATAALRDRPAALHRARHAGRDLARGHQPARQRGQVEPARRRRDGARRRRRAARDGLGPRLRPGGPALRLQPLLPRRLGARHAGVGPRPRDREADRREPRRQRSARATPVAAARC